MPIRKSVEEHKPFIYRLNYMLYSAFMGYLVCYLYVAGYGGTMPPPGEFSNFIADSWGILTTGAVAPILLSFVTTYFMKRRRSTD